MLTIEGATLDERRLMRRVERAVFKALKQDNFFVTEISVIDAERIRKLNAESRGVDSITDVLSFPAFEKLKPPVDKSEFDEWDYEGNRVGLGCIVICRERAEEQARAYGHTYKRELGFLTCHGLLHLMGYDHVVAEDEETMTALQKQIMDKVGLKRE